MFRMDAINLADIYVFLRITRRSRVERLVVQLPTGTRDLSMEKSLQAVKEQRLTGLLYLMVVKMTNFKGLYYEMKLASFLLSMASFLKKLLLAAPCSQEEQLLPLKKTSAHAEIILSDADDPEI